MYYASRRKFLKPELKKIERTCLRCGKDFIANGRYNRLCLRCGYDIDHNFTGVTRKRMVKNERS